MYIDVISDLLYGAYQHGCNNSSRPALFPHSPCNALLVQTVEESNIESKKCGPKRVKELKQRKIKRQPRRQADRQAAKENGKAIKRERNVILMEWNRLLPFFQGGNGHRQPTEKMRQRGRERKGKK